MVGIYRYGGPYFNIVPLMMLSNIFTHQCSCLSSKIGLFYYNFCALCILFFAVMEQSSSIDAEKLSRNVVAPSRKASFQTAAAEEKDTITPAKRCRLGDVPQDALRSSVVTPAPSAVGSLTPMQDKEAIRSLLMSEAGYDSSAASVAPKRLDYICWDDYFMAVAALSAYRSKDPLNPTGACIVDASNRIIGIGYNGFPSGCSDDCLPWNATEAASENSHAWLHSQTPYVVHSEVNAVLNKVTPDCVGARLYKMDFPCNECAKLIVQVGITEVVYIHEGPDNDSTRASRILLKLAGVNLRQYRPMLESVELDFWKPLNETERQEASIILGQEKLLSKSDTPVATIRNHRELLRHEAGYDPATTPSSKRTNAISWDDYFMAMAFLTARRSKDPNTQVGACIVDTNKRIVGLGYNGFPMGCSDDVLPWSRQAESELHKKYLYVCHAEVNAILNKRSADVKGATLYVALFPCNECSKSIIQAGIKAVVYMSDQYHDTPPCRASRILLKMAGVDLRRHIPATPSLRIFLQSQVNSTL